MLPRAYLLWELRTVCCGKADGGCHISMGAAYPPCIPGSPLSCTLSLPLSPTVPSWDSVKLPGESPADDKAPLKEDESLAQSLSIDLHLWVSHPAGLHPPQP